MKKSIFVTAVSGSGKSTLCKTLKDLGYVAYDIEDIPGLFAWRDDKTGQPIPGEYHDSLKLAQEASWMCDKEQLRKVIHNEKAGVAFYCGAGANIDDIWDLFDEVVMLQVSDQTTVKRLSSRKPGEFGHTREVRDWVLSWKMEVEKGWLRKGAISVDAEGTPQEVAHNVIAAVSSLRNSLL